MITDYTTCDSIRAVLGVETLEIPDDVILAAVYDTQVQMFFDDIYENLAAYYAQLKKKRADNAEDTTKPGPTFVERKIIGTVEVLVTYYVAQLLCQSIALSAPKVIEDGKAAKERVSDPFKTLEGEIKAYTASMLGKLKDLLETQDLLPKTAKVYPSFMSGVRLAIDPVTGVAQS